MQEEDQEHSISTIANKRYHRVRDIRAHWHGLFCGEMAQNDISAVEGSQFQSANLKQHSSPAVESHWFELVCGDSIIAY